MWTQAVLKRILMFIGFILSGLIMLIFVADPEPFRVPIQGEVTPITTKSGEIRTLREAATFFESSIENTVPGGSLVAITSWSPNGKYILANLQFTEGGKTVTRAYVLDLLRRLYILVPNAPWIDRVAWSGTTFAYQSENGFYTFDIPAAEGFHINTPGMPESVLFSPGGDKIAYDNNGITIYDLERKSSRQITTDSNDRAALWSNDGKTLYVARTDGTTKSTTYANTLLAYSFATKKFAPITSFSSQFKNAKWISTDHTALVMLGTDDNTSAYFFDLNKNTSTFIAPVSEGGSIINTSPEGFTVIQGNILALYSTLFEKEKEFTLLSSHPASAALLPRNQLLLVSGERIGDYTLSIIDLESGIEEKIKTVPLPYVLSSPDGTFAATLDPATHQISFIDIME